jgi:hypothetical protein
MADRAPHDPRPTLPRFLTGGPEVLRLSPASVALLGGYGLALQAAIHGILGSDAQNQWPVECGLALMIVIGALLTAGVAARWLGGPLATAAGLLQLTGLYALGLPVELPPAGPMLTVLVTGAMGLFAVANVPGRLRFSARLPPSVLFYCCSAGPLLLRCDWAETAGVLLACLAYLLINQDGRALGFLLHPLGLGVLGIVSACALWLDLPMAPPSHATGWHSPFTVALGMLPWTPLCITAIVAGFWRGHYATAFWQFVACWVISPLVLAALGLLSDCSAIAMTCAPLSILAATGFYDLIHWLQGRTARIVFRTGRPGK